MRIRAALRFRARAQELPLPVFGDQEYPEDTRLRYRFLDLRRERLHKNILLRANIVQPSLRRRMIEPGASPSSRRPNSHRLLVAGRRARLPGAVAPLSRPVLPALPQALRQFKQLIQLLAGFDRYFQIAPCFRDGDGRADRSPGEFYQLDLEMSLLVTQT